MRNKIGIARGTLIAVGTTAIVAWSKPMAGDVQNDTVDPVRVQASSPERVLASLRGIQTLYVNRAEQAQLAGLNFNSLSAPFYEEIRVHLSAQPVVGPLQWCAAAVIGNSQERYWKWSMDGSYLSGMDNEPMLKHGRGPGTTPTPGASMCTVIRASPCSTIWGTRPSRCWSTHMKRLFASQEVETKSRRLRCVNPDCLIQEIMN